MTNGLSACGLRALRRNPMARLVRTNQASNIAVYPLQHRLEGGAPPPTSVRLREIRATESGAGRDRTDMMSLVRPPREQTPWVTLINPLDYRVGIGIKTMSNRVYLPLPGVPRRPPRIPYRGIPFVCPSGWTFRGEQFRGGGRSPGRMSRQKWRRAMPGHSPPWKRQEEC